MRSQISNAQRPPFEKYLQDATAQSIFPRTTKQRRDSSGVKTIVEEKTTMTGKILDLSLIDGLID